MAGFPVFEVELGRLGWRPWRQLLSAVRAFHPDILHSHGKGPGLYGRMMANGLGLASVHTFHGWHPPRRYRLVYTALERWLSRRTDALIHVAPSEQDEALRLGLRPQQSWCIPNGVQLPEDPAHVPFSCGPQVTGEFMVGSVARPDPVKRLPILRHAVELAQGTLLLPTGSIWNSRAAYRLMDVYASASDGEGCPYGILDAMAHGLPVVATRVRGHTDLVRHGVTGFLTSPGDSHQMAYYLRLLATDPAMRAGMGENARRLIEQDYRLEDMVRRTADCYRQV